MIDIHAHILPDLDDGSEDMEESLEMAELAVESGVEIMAATPHSNQMGRFENFQSEQLLEKYRQLRTALEKEKSHCIFLRAWKFLPQRILHRR